ncbi:hypothetical protein NIE88_03070 [Sporolactobacillus shoreicorticis]|uniref:Uncharacterized protein n=1 Tax=Sporolactobacillus shoreicorticis TaxID=1923877 RepID=A0ABW5RXK6_9BACL|nr:hypothetical protein [Sporolactobacillus shoreicorticis]MCO7124757.1 hypothetical protein [Sporolactobacillus shoreicorticis]
MTKSFKKKAFYNLSLAAFMLFACIWFSFNSWFFDHIVANRTNDAFLYLILSFICFLLFVLILWHIHNALGSLFCCPLTTLANLIRILENIELAQNNESFARIIDKETATVDTEVVKRIIAENT